MSFTHYLENKLLDHVFGGGDYARPATLQVGLSVTAVQDDGSGIAEPTGGYQRIEISNDNQTWSPSETDTAEGRGMKTNTIPIEFPAATSDWGVITHFFLTDGVNILGHGVLTPEKAITSGQIARFGAGELIITLD